jgi:imidazolonepropionase-like amidohydrolase
MRTPQIFIVLALVGTAAAQTTPPNGIRTKTPDFKAFTNATIVVSPLQTIQNATLIIKDGKVQDVGAGIPIPAGAAVTDAKGKTIYPGFVDPFTDYGLPVDQQPAGSRWGGDRGPQLEGKRVGCNAWNDAIHAENNWVQQFQPDQKVAETYMKQGVTAVQSARMDGIFRGRSFVTLLGQGLPNDLVLRSYSWQFASFDKGTSTQDYPSSQMGSIALMRQMFLDVDWYKKAMAAYAADPTQKKPEFNTALEALGAAGGQKIVFETDDDLALLRAARISKEFSIPFELVGSGYEYRRLDQIKATGLPLIVPVQYPKTPEVKTIEDELDVDLATLRHWERARTNPAQLERSGITFAFTSKGLKDRGDYLKNIRDAVSYGLSRKAALAALTTVPAQLCELSSVVGSLEKGRFANFILCDGDIFDATTNIFSVWVAGKAYEFKVPDQSDFRGEFAAAIGDKTFDLSLKGDLYQPIGEFKTGDKHASLTGLQVDRDKIIFSSVMDSLGLTGTTRFAARLIDSTLRGQCEFADGSRIDWTAPRTSRYQAAKDTSAKPDKAPDTVLISKLTWPNVGFGYAQRPKQENVLIKNATVWTCEADGILSNTDLLILDSKIAGIGKNLSAPGGVRIVDASGRHVTPGIIDEHSHVAVSSDVNEGTAAVTAEVRIGDVVDPDDINIYRALGGGVTSLHSLHGSANPIGAQCQPIKLKWGTSSEEMKFAAAAPTIKFALGENVKQSNWGDRNVVRYPQSRMGVETIVKDALQAAKEYAADWDQYSSLSARDKTRAIPPRRDLQLDALLEVLRSQRFVHSHAYMAPEILMTMRLAEQFGFRIAVFEHILEGYKVADEMAAHGAGGSSFSDWWAYKFEVYDAIPQNACLMHDRGVLVSINSDDPEQGRRLNQEAAKSVMYCGMSKEEALKMVTINPAMQLKVDKLTGSLKVGKQADFVIWDKDPLSVYAKPVETWIEGAPYFTRTTDSALKAENDSERARLIQKIISSDDRGNEGGGPRRGGPDQHGDDVFYLGESIHEN